MNNLLWRANSSLFSYVERIQNHQKKKKKKKKKESKKKKKKKKTKNEVATNTSITCYYQVLLAGFPLKFSTHGDKISNATKYDL